MRDKGFLQLSFEKRDNQIDVTIEDNGIGIAESKKSKTANQKQHSGRGITNTLERIKILNELYHQNITCQVQDKPAPETGVRVSLTIPLSKKNRHEN
jgi:sensor histidine kinase YesM